MKYGELNLGQIEAIVNKLGGMDGVKKLLSGVMIVQNIKHIIDLAAGPFMPEGWKGEEHQKGGQWEWDSTKVKLHLSDGQKDGRYIAGNKLREELKSQPVMNANILDYLLAHPELIPEEWKDKAVFFWGTIYRRADGDLCVRYLCWSGGGWLWGATTGSATTGAATARRRCAPSSPWDLVTVS